jgi:hypothetical protein
MVNQDGNRVVALKCVGCGKTPEQIDDYTPYAEDEGLTNTEYVSREEGTLNTENGHFYCDSCYVSAGMPLGVAP